MDYVLLGKRVRIRRQVLGLTQEGLAEKIGVSTSFIGHIERGSRKLSVETLYALCKALDTSADFLLGI
jgi:transcriptional regulator with XRE-family HTH domain